MIEPPRVTGGPPIVYFLSKIKRKEKKVEEAQFSLYTYIKPVGCDYERFQQKEKKEEKVSRIKNEKK